MQSHHPIGIFDSGSGGLTVAKALVELLPNENIIYFGDTAHYPYGDKSVTAIQNYAEKICSWFLEKNCKLILVACHSASVAASVALQTLIGKSAHLVNVIDPLLDFVKNNYRGKKLGLIGTRLTVSSELYQKKIAALAAKITLQARATPLLVPVIEEGLADAAVVDELLKIYLSGDDFKNIDALILACTHYPLVKKKIEAFYQNKIEIIDTAVIVAAFVKTLLTEKGLLYSGAKGTRHFYVSDYTEGFARTAKLFFGDDLDPEYYPMWR